MLEKLTPRVRQYGYALSAAVLSLLTGYNIIAPEHVPLWLGVVAAVFAISATSTAAVMVRDQRKTGVLPD